MQSCFENEMGPPQKTTTRYAQWSLNNILQRLERLQWFLCTWHLEKTPVRWDGVCWFYKIKFHWIRQPQLRLAHSDPRLNTHTHTTHCSRQQTKTSKLQNREAFCDFCILLLRFILIPEHFQEIWVFFCPKPIQHWIRFRVSNSLGVNRNLGVNGWMVGLMVGLFFSWRNFNLLDLFVFLLKLQVPCKKTHEFRRWNLW